LVTALVPVHVPVHVPGYERAFFFCLIFDERVFFLITQHTHPVALFFLIFLNIVAIFFLRIVLNVVALVFTLVQVILLRMIEGVEDRPHSPAVGARAGRRRAAYTTSVGYAHAPGGEATMAGRAARGD